MTMPKYKFMQEKEIEMDDKYYLLQCDDTYLSILLMPNNLYSKLSDFMIIEDTDYFWGLQSNELTILQYETVRDTLFKRFGRKVNLTGTEYIFWLIGSLPQELLPYLKALK